jgi:hypothetical protein
MNLKQLFRKRKHHSMTVRGKTVENGQAQEEPVRDLKREPIDSPDEMSDEALEQVAGGYWLRSSSSFL